MAKVHHISSAVARDPLVRMSISLPGHLLEQFDDMLEKKHAVSRSQAISEMIHQQITSHRVEVGEETMAGTINLVYDHTVPDLQKSLAELQYIYLDEVISSLNVNLTHEQTLSVLLVQGPGRKLRQIADKLINQRGVITGDLLLSTAILPPVHPLPINSHSG